MTPLITTPNGGSFTVGGVLTLKQMVDCKRDLFMGKIRHMGNDKSHTIDVFPKSHQEMIYAVNLCRSYNSIIKPLHYTKW